MTARLLIGGMKTAVMGHQLKLRDINQESSLYKALSTSRAHAAIPSRFPITDSSTFLFVLKLFLFLLRSYLILGRLCRYKPTIYFTYSFSLPRCRLPFLGPDSLSLPTIIILASYFNLCIWTCLPVISNTITHLLSLWDFILRSCISVFSHN